MPKPFRGVVNVDIRDSVPDWEPFLQPKAPEGAPNVLMIVWDDVGYGAMDVFGGPIETPTMRRIAECGPALLELPHDGALLAHAFEPAHRTQRHEQRHGVHHRGLGRLPGVLRPDPVRERHDLRGARTSTAGTPTRSASGT